MKTDKKNGELTFSEKCQKLNNAVIALALLDIFKRNPLKFALAKALAFQLELDLSDELIEKKIMEPLKRLSNSIPGESRMAEKNEEMTYGEKIDMISCAVIALALIEVFERNPLSIELAEELAVHFELYERDEEIEDLLIFLQYYMVDRFKKPSLINQSI